MTNDNPWTLIFAGTADIDEHNLTAQLDNWLPMDLEVNPPVIQDTISPDTHPGLVKVRRYLADQFGDDALEPVASVIDHLSAGLQSGPDQYLVVLWGDGGDEGTEKLVDQAIRLGVTVLDLTDGLEELTLDSKPPIQEPAPARVSRRSMVADDPAPLPEDAEPPAELASAPSVDIKLVERVVADVLHRALLAALTELYETTGGHGAAVAPAPAPVAVAAKPAAITPAEPAVTVAAVNGGHPVQATPGVRYRGDANVEPVTGTKKYVINPATGEHLRLRGRPRTDRKDWEFIYLTPDQEQEFGLVEA